jgi:murein DD-endopeptidase MepM/ murein hydrolase activator NlpD
MPPPRRPAGSIRAPGLPEKDEPFDVVQAGPNIAPFRSNAGQMPPLEFDPDGYSAVGDLYRDSWMGSFWDDAARTRFRTKVKGYDGIANVPSGYEQWSAAFISSGSPEETAQIKRDLDENIAIRRRIDGRGTTTNLIAGLVPSLADPLNAFGLPLKGVGLGAGVLRGAGVVGVTVGGSELYRMGANPLVEPEEAALNTVLGIGAGAFVGGALGAWGSGRTRANLPHPVQGEIVAPPLEPPVPPVRPGAPPPPPPRGRRPAGVAPGEAPRFGAPPVGPVSSGFGWRTDPITGKRTFHAGVDFRAPNGTAITAPADGVVTGITDAGPRGISVTYQIAPGVESSFFHMSRRAVQVGDKVRRGDLLGRVGSTGRSTGNHLHWSMKVNGKPVDPLSYQHGNPNITYSTPTAATNAVHGVGIPETVRVGEVSHTVEIGTNANGRIVNLVSGKTAEQMVEEEVEAVSRSFNTLDTPEERPLTRAERDAAFTAARAEENVRFAETASGIWPEYRGKDIDDFYLALFREVPGGVRIGQISKWMTETNNVRSGFVSQDLAALQKKGLLTAPDADGLYRLAEVPAPTGMPGMVTKTVTRYDKKGNVIGTHEIEVPATSPLIRGEPGAPERAGVAARTVGDVAKLEQLANRLEARANQMLALARKNGYLNERFQATELQDKADVLRARIAAFDAKKLEGKWSGSSSEKSRNKLVNELAKIEAEIAAKQGKTHVQLIDAMFAEVERLRSGVTPLEAENLGTDAAGQPVRMEREALPEAVEEVDELGDEIAATDRADRLIHEITETSVKMLGQRNKWDIMVAHGLEPGAEFTPELQARFLDDVRAWIGKRYDEISVKMTKGYRAAIRAVINGIAGMGVIMSPAGLSKIPFEIGGSARASATHVIESAAKLPKGADHLSDVSRFTYEVSAPLAMKRGKGFFIADKPNGEIHVFGKDGRFIGSSPALFGKTPGEAVSRGVYNLNSGVMTTPAGSYEIRFENTTIYNGGKIGRLYEQGSTDPLSVGGVAVHSVYLGEDVKAEGRLGRLSTWGVGDNKISGGCINTTEPFFVNNVLPHVGELDGGMVFTIPDDPALASKYFQPHQDETPFGRDRDEDGLPIPRGQQTDTMRRTGRGARRNRRRTGEGAVWEGDAETLQIDMQAANNSFRAKAWASPSIEGEDPLDDAHFPTLGDWLNFNERRTIIETLNPIGEGEAAGAYANRINQRALKEMEKGSFKLSGNEIAKIAIAPTPHGQMDRLIKDPEAAVHGSFMDLAGDMGVQQARNLTGGVTTPGGSVHQRSLMWQTKFYDVRTAIRQGYQDYLGLPAVKNRLTQEARMIAARIPFIGAKSSGNLNLTEFRAEVAKWVMDPDGVLAAKLQPDMTAAPAAKKAAQVFNQVMEIFRKEQQALGMFRTTKDFENQIESKLRWIDKAEREIDWLRDRDPFTAARIHDAVAAKRAEIAELEIRKAMPVMTPDEPNYYYRMWNVQALLDKPEDILQLLERKYALKQDPDPAGAAQRAYTLLVTEPAGGMTPGSPSFLEHREIPITNREAWDYIVQDAELVMGIYTKRVAAQIEMTRMFGDPFGLDHLDTLRQDLRVRGTSEADIDQSLQLWQDARDRILGQFHDMSPLAMSKRTVRAMKGITNLVSLGKILFSQVSDLASMTLTYGGKSVMQGFWGQILGDVSRFTPGGLAKQAGEAMEIVTARMTNRMMDHDDALLLSHGGSKAEQLIQAAQTPFFILNMMNPATIAMKEVSGMLAGHRIMEASQRIADAFAKGAEPDAKDVAWLAQRGISATDAQIIATMPAEHGESGLWLLNITEWDDARARQLVLAAAQGLIRKGVVTPGPLDRPAIFDGVFHSKKGRAEGKARIADAQMKIDTVRNEQWPAVADLADDDPQKIGVIKQLQELHRELGEARRNLGRAGRKEYPVASLPFQFKAFTMASSSKTLHGLLSLSDRHKIEGMLSILAMAGVATWLKSPSSFAWDKMSWTEFAGTSIENSNLLGWFGSVLSPIEAVFGTNLLGPDPDPENERIMDEIGQFTGPAIGKAGELIEAFVTGDTDDQIYRARRSVPFASIWWLDKSLNLIAAQFEADDEVNRKGRQPANDIGHTLRPLDYPTSFGEVPPGIIGTEQLRRAAPPISQVQAEAAAFEAAHPELGKTKRPRRPPAKRFNRPTGY